MPISEAVSKSINSPIGRMEWPMVKNGNFMLAAVLFEFAPGVSRGASTPRLVQSDTIGLVALDFILRIIRRSTADVAFIIDGSFVHFDDFSAHTSGFRIPAHVIGILERLGHGSVLVRSL
jgi:hypothetical protein